MRTIRTFKKWMELGEPEVLVKSKIYIEDLSGGEKTKKIVLLKQLLKDFDFFYHYSDDRRAYQRGKEQQDTIEKLVKEIGKDGLISLYKCSNITNNSILKLIKKCSDLGKVNITNCKSITYNIRSLLLNKKIKIR